MRHRTPVFEHVIEAAAASEGPPILSTDATSPALGGVGGGLPIQDLPSIWELLADSTDEVAMHSEVTELLTRMEQSPQFRRAQVAGSLAQLREVLRETSHKVSTGDEVSLPVGTVLILADMLLRHQP